MEEKNQIEKYKEQFLENLESPNVGDLYTYKSDPEFIRVDKIQKNGKVKYSVTVDGVTWEKGNRDYLDLRHLREYYKKLHVKQGESAEKTIQDILRDLSRALIDPSFLDSPEAEENSTALIKTGGKLYYEETAKEIIRLKARAEVITNLAKAKAQEIQRVASELAKKLKKVMRVLGILEVYLGVHEEIFQITQGAPAPINEPISIRQMILYMDEEAAIVNALYTHKGIKLEDDINHENIETFDNWLLKEENLNRVLPERRGIVALRPSRQKERYKSLDIFSRIDAEQADSMLYLLIRNGENLYRVWTNIIGTDTFFPTKDDSEKLQDLFTKESMYSQEEAENNQSKWLTNALLIQGLIDRTDVFMPLPPGRIEFTKPETYAAGGMVNLIADAEPALTDGHISFTDWREDLLSKVKKGTRIYFTGVGWDKDGHADRLNRNIRYFSDSPEPGIYTVSSINVGTWHTNYDILFMPHGEIYDSRAWDSKPRKNRFSFSVYRNEFINYDDIELDKLDYYLQSRHERRNYRDIMPLLLGIRSLRMEEIKQESDFVKLLSDKHGIEESLLIQLVEWWKKKVINKRPISQDDSKAWRMIVKEAKKRSK